MTSLSSSITRTTLLCASTVMALAFSITAQTVTQIIDASGDGTGNTLDRAYGMSVDCWGNAYVAGILTDNVFKITPAGQITEIINASGDGTNTLKNPIYTTVDNSGNVFVVGSFTNNVFKIEPDGTITQVLDQSGTGMGQSYIIPERLAVDTEDNLYASCFGSDNVLKVTPAGVITEIIDVTGDGTNDLLEASGLAVDVGGNVYVGGVNSHNVFKITPGGVKTQIVDAAGAGPGQELDTPTGVGVEGSGHVFVAGLASDNVLMITPGGTITEIINASGNGTNPFDFPCDLVLDAAGNVYVSGANSDNVFEITDPGQGSQTITEIIDDLGAGLGQTLDRPCFGLAVDASGSVYVPGDVSDNAFRITPGVAPPSDATAFNYNGSGLNLDLLSSNPVVVGSTWSVDLAPQPTRGPGAWVLFLRSADAAGPILDLGPIFGLPAAGASELLVNPGAYLANFSPPAHAGGGSTATLTTPVPANCALVGSEWFAQAVVLGDLPTGAGSFDPWFSSAVGGVIGTF